MVTCRSTADPRQMTLPRPSRAHDAPRFLRAGHASQSAYASRWRGSGASPLGGSSGDARRPLYGQPRVIAAGSVGARPVERRDRLNAPVGATVRLAEPFGGRSLIQHGAVCLRVHASRVSRARMRYVTPDIFPGRGAGWRWRAPGYFAAPMRPPRARRFLKSRIFQDCPLIRISRSSVQIRVSAPGKSIGCSGYS